MIVKPYYILVVALALMSNTVRSQDIPGKVGAYGYIRIHLDLQTSIEYIVSYGDSSKPINVIPRLCTYNDSATGDEYIGTIINRNGMRKCVRNN